MRIGFDAKRAFSNNSGLGNYSRDLIKGLFDFFPNNEYILFTPNPNTNLLESKYRKNVVTSKFLTPIGKSYWRSFLMSKDIEKQKLDIFHGLSNELPLNIHNTGAKKLVTIHDLIFLKFPALYPYFDRKIYEQKFLYACKKADLILATSNQTKTDIIKYFQIPENKIKVVYQSYNEVFNNILSKEQKLKILKKYNLPENYILTVGTIELRKNVLNVVKAIYYYNLDINYVLIGKCTKYCREVLKYAREKGIEDRIIIRNNVETEDLPAIYQSAELFIYPSVYEGFGIPILEAFASQVPVITADHGSTSEIADYAAVQTEVHNPKALGVAIKTILENSSLKLELVNEGKKRIKLFNKQIVINEINKIYNYI